MTSRVRRWWDEPDHFEWVTQFLRRRGFLRSTQIVMATVAASASMVTFSFVVGLGWSAEARLAVGLLGALFTVWMTAFWLTRWPTRRQSEIAVTAGTLFVAIWSIAQPNSSVAVLACTATAVTGGYIAFFHNTRLLLFNFAVAIAVTTSATWRLGADTDVATAVAAFWLAWFPNITVPLAIRGITKAMGTYAERSGSDPLTGLLNRRGFADAITHHLAEAPPSATHLGLVMVDLDGFKLVNDTHGHAAGDRALQAVAELLRQRSPRGAAICRAGGEEFLVAVAGPRSGAESVAGQLCRAIAGLPQNVTASVGACSIELDDLRSRDADAVIDELIATADTAMYVAKRNGGNQVHCG
ncbi:GGDEF domain-containing protein [Mycolicibacterium sp. BiH015]|uniref:GGDEF domain-containing protein n=1 Tax=Mycolicibacterium sp. BiH015 TaxID=3018808 RepID=UPI0022E2C887|nr:GGDEF domain-containing protein [Mycolicibacterium sp. BiH015]MDA2892535.1 GGDEF domain-containing protein [Mycolicibacterium sp. BiH015]